MKRRNFLKGMAASSLVVGLPFNCLATKSNYDVVVIGAGLSGLSAAYNLKKLGLSVLVLEGDDRIGGRVKTLDNVVTAPEAGGLQIGKAYGYMRTLAMELDVALEPLAGFMRGDAYIIDNQLLNLKDWPKHRLNRLNTQEKNLPPSALFFHYLKQMPKMNSSSDWTQKIHQNLDRSMLSLLKQFGVSEQGVSLINANINANNLTELSGADAIHTFTQMMEGGRVADKAVGGNTRFIEALAGKLAGDIQINKVVTSIKSDNGATIKCEDGSRYQAKHCICTIPFKVLRNIELNAPLNSVQKDAIDNLNYTAITQVHYEVSDDSWLEDGLPANIWTNGLAGRVFASKGKDNTVKHLVSWVNGDQAKELDKLTDVQGIQQVTNYLTKNRPSLKNKIQPVYINSWGNNPFSGGAYSSFAPGQVTKFAGKMGEPAGNIYFAGEHINHEYSGMESALVSGLEAVDKIKQSLT